MLNRAVARRNCRSWRVGGGANGKSGGAMLFRAVPKSEATQLAKRWRRASNALDGGLRVAYLASEIEAHDLGLAAAALDEVCGAAEQASPMRASCW